MSATFEHPSPALARAREARGAAALSIELVNPLDHREEITQLFLAHARPEFPDHFERAYPDAVAAGATSWLGRGDDGRLCAHIAQFPRQFVFGRRVVQGALLANLMVATAHRSFWLALALARRVVQDLKVSRSVDFIYADPNEHAQPVLRAAGFRPLGALRRFVLPLTDGRRSLALAIRLYHLTGRLRATPLAAVERRADEVDGVMDRVPVVDARSLRPVRQESLYRGRLAGYPSADDHWYTFHLPGPEDAVVGKALVRGLHRGGAVTLSVVQCEPMSLLSSVLVALARRLRDEGAARLEVWVSPESRAGKAVRRAGFVARAEHVPVLAHPLTDLGVAAIAANCDWQLLPVDLDR